MTRLTDTIGFPPADRVTYGAAGAGVLSPMVAFGLAPVLAMATILTTLLSNGNVFAAIAPPILALGLWAIWVAPLRTTLALAMVIALSVDKPGDAEGYWSSPLSVIGSLAFLNLNKVIPVEPLKFSGVFALLGLLLLVRVYRALTGRERDTPDSLMLAAPLRLAFVFALVTLSALALFGVARGGALQMAKVQTQGFLQILAAAYLFGSSLRGVRDYRTLGALIVVAASAKALLAIWLYSTLPLQLADASGILRDREYVTSHGDSILFASAMAVLIGPLFLRPTRRHVYACLFLVPLIVFGIVANDRRLAWVQVALIVTAFIGLHPTSWITRRLARVVVLGSPLLLAYLIVGWNSPSRVFGPVQFVRGIVQAERTDGSLDRSTFFRDMENFNLVYTFRSNPVLGTGLGRPFQQGAETDSLEGFKEYLYLPHNSMIGLWAFTGFVGFTGFFTTIIVALFLGARAHAFASTPEQRIAITAGMGVVASYLVHLWADIGFTEAVAIFPVGIALAILGQMAVETGAWPSRWRATQTV